MTTLEDVVRSMSGCYNSIIINTLAGLESKWMNAVTTIKFSMDEEKEHTTTFQQEEVMIIESSLPFNRWKDLKEWFREARLKFGELEVHLPTNLYPDTFPGSIDQYTFPEWPAFHCEQTLPNLPHSICEKVRRVCPKFGHNSAQTLAKYRLGVSEWASDRILTSDSSFIEIVAPIYAKIEKGSAKITKDFLEIPLTFHRETNPAELNIEFTDIHGRGKHLISRGVPPYSDIISKHVVKINNSDFLDKDFVSLKLILLNKDLGKLDETYVQLRDLIVKSDIVNNPLFSALSVFTPKSRFQQILLGPGSEPTKKQVRPQDVFEETVSKFLSLSGFSAIRLNGHEEIKNTSGNVIGAADILAYDNNNGKLFVVSCKTSMPDRNAVDWIKTTSEEVKNRLPDFLSKIIDVAPIIVTSQISPSLKDESKKYGVIIIDKSDLEELFNLSQTRQLSYSDLVK